MLSALPGGSGRSGDSNSRHRAGSVLRFKWREALLHRALNGEAVVLLHGRGNTVDIWTATGLLQRLSTNHHVGAFDARGHGKSDKPHDPKQYGRELALDVVRLWVGCRSGARMSLVTRWERRPLRSC